jgi:uncharacterized membrane protein (DUF485 family)
MSEAEPGAKHLLEDPEFKDLVARKDRVSLILTVATLILYYGFIALVAFAPGLFGERPFAGIPLGIPLGVGVILGCWALTGVYVRWANSRYDAMVDRIQEKAGRGA